MYQKTSQSIYNKVGYRPYFWTETKKTERICKLPMSDERKFLNVQLLHFQDGYKRIKDDFCTYESGMGCYHSQACSNAKPKNEPAHCLFDKQIFHLPYVFIGLKLEEEDQGSFTFSSQIPLGHSNSMQYKVLKVWPTLFTVKLWWSPMSLPELLKVDAEEYHVQALQYEKHAKMLTEAQQSLKTYDVGCDKERFSLKLKYEQDLQRIENNVIRYRPSFVKEVNNCSDIIHMVERKRASLEKSVLRHICLHDLQRKYQEWKDGKTSTLTIGWTKNDPIIDVDIIQNWEGYISMPKAPTQAIWTTFQAAQPQATLLHWDPDGSHLKTLKLVLAIKGGDLTFEDVPMHTFQPWNSADSPWENITRFMFFVQNP